MSSDKASLSIVLLNKEYRISCKDSERAALLESADFLNERMEALKNVHRVAPPERLALLVALNLSNEFLNRRPSESDDPALLKRIQSLCERVDQAIDEASEQV